MAYVPFGNSKIISSHAVIYSYCVPRPGKVIWRWKWAGTGGEFKSVTHFHLHFLLLFFLPHMKVITQVFVSSADYVAFVRAPHRQACWSQGCPQRQIWTSIKIDPHISQPKTDGCWITVELSRMPSREIYTSKKTSWQHFCSGKITQQCVCSIFQSVLTLQALLKCKCFEITSLIYKKDDTESNLQWRSNIIEPGNVSISQHVLWVQTVQNDRKHIVFNLTESLW